jgi:O-antigen/teichoic acid export membrane protein
LIKKVLNAAQFAAGDVLWKVANIVLLAVASRVLPADEAALVVLSQTASMILLSLGDLGFRWAGIRLIAVDRAQTALVMRAVFWRRIASVLLLGLPAAMICAAMVTDNLRGFLGLALIVLAYLPYFAASDWVLLAIGRSELAGIARAVYAFVMLVLSGLVYVTGADVFLFALIIACSYGGFALASALLLRLNLDYARAVPGRGRSNVVEDDLAWGASLALAIAFTLNTLFHSMEILLAGVFLGEEASASFAAPFRLIFSLYAIGWILSQYFSPHFARFSPEKGDDSRYWLAYAAGFLVFGVAAATAAFLGGHWLVALVYGDAFDQADVLMRALAPTIAMDAVVACLGTLLVMQNKGKTSAVTIGLGCFASVAVFLLCKDSGLMVAVYAKYAAYTTLMLAQLFCLIFIGRAASGTQQA